MTSKRRKSGSPDRVVGYIRVSTEDQALGPVAQKSALARWCMANGATMVACFEESVSGGAELEKRPALMHALDALAEQEAGTLLVAKRDRLARDVVLAGLIGRLVDKAGARVVSADGVGAGDGPEAALMASIVDAFAQYERALIRFRTKAALAVKKSRGERVGEVSIGQRVNEDTGKLEQDETELRAVARVLELRKTGYSIRRIAEALNLEGVPARGGRWHKTTIQRLLDRSTG